MANGGRYSAAAAINRAAAVIGSTDPRYQAPEERSWKGYWSSLWCFGSQKSSKQVMPAAHLDGATDSSRGWAAGGPGQAGPSLAPPSSPASLVNSSLQSPASFTLPLSAASEGMFSPGPANMMFTIGPYAHETQLVSPPVFSTFTTEPSTAPLTPPPELAHVTTPSSPDVPFAQLLASSLEAKPLSGGNRSFFSPFSLASPGEAGTGEFRGSYIYQECPFADLISPASGFPTSGASSPLPDTDSSAQFSVPLGTSVSTSPMSTTDLIFSRMPSATLLLPESPDYESGKTVLDVASGRKDIDLDFRNDVNLEGEPHRNCISHTKETFQNMDACQSINVTFSEKEETQGMPLSTELQKDEMSYLQTALQSYGSDHEGVFVCKEIFPTSSTKAKVVTYQALDTDLPPEEKKGILQHTASDFQGFSGTSCSSETIISEYMQEDPKATFEEENKNLGIEDQLCHQYPDVQLETNVKTCVQNVGTVDSRTFGEMSVKCGELSPALKLTSSPESNFKHLPQWTHLGVTGSI